MLQLVLLRIGYAKRGGHGRDEKSQGCGGGTTTPGTGSRGPPRQGPRTSPTWPGLTSVTRSPASTASPSLSQSENFEPRDCWASGSNNQMFCPQHDNDMSYTSHHRVPAIV